MLEQKFLKQKKIERKTEQQYGKPNKNKTGAIEKTGKECQIRTQFSECLA